MPIERTSGAGSPDAPAAVVLRGALLPTLAVGILAVVVLWIVRGAPGAVSGLLGLLVTVLFFGSGLLLLHRFATGGNPMLFLAVGMAVYLGQVIILLAVVLVLGRADWLDGKAFAVEVLVALIVWQVFQLRAWRAARVPVYGPDDARRGTDDRQ